MLSSKFLKLLLLAGMASSAPALAQELPTGASVGAGMVGISSPAPGALTINQSSQAAVVNWQSFSIGPGGSVIFNQPNGQSVILNRVTGSATTSIAGQLTANGQVFIVNPNGIAITSTGVVNAAGFVGSTLGISDEDFLKGNYAFAGDGSSAGVSNAGRINIGPGGYAALLGGRVNNSGIISAPLGKIGLGAGEQVTLDLSGDGFLQVAMPSQDGGTDALVTSSGTLSADGGRIEISVAAAQDAARHVINLSGVVEARTVSGHSGAIVLGGAGGAVRVSGTLDTSARTPAPVGGPAVGGNITITGADIGLQGATLDASGLNGGGQVRIGGDYYGQGILPTAATLSVDDTSIIYADALEDGDGGGIVLWSNQLTSFAGNISSKGAGSGEGGFVEVSGKQLLAYTGFANLSAPSGNFGTLLLDPYNIIISNDPTSNNSGPGAFTPNGNDSVINATQLAGQLTTANVTISTGGAGSPGAQAGNISVLADVVWAASIPTQLRLEAFNDINVYADIRGNGGGVTLVAGRDINVAAPIVTTLSTTLQAGRDVNFSSLYATSILIDTGSISASSVLITAGRAVSLTTGNTIGSTAGDIVIAGTRFSNQSGPAALQPGAGNRFLVYSTNPANDVRGGLTGAEAYNQNYQNNPPGSVPGGNTFLYADPVSSVAPLNVPAASQVPGRNIPLGGFGGADNAVPNFLGLNNGVPGGVRVADNGQPAAAGAPEVTKENAQLSLQILTQRSDTFTKALEQCQVALDQSKDTTAFIDCASTALEAYGEAIDDPLIRLPPELQGTVQVIRETVQRMRTANTDSDKKAAITEARAAVRDLVDFVKQQTALVSAVDPETEAVLVQHGQVMTAALEKLDLAMVSAVEI